MAAIRGRRKVSARYLVAAQSQLTSSIFQPSLHVAAEPDVWCVSEAPTTKRASCFALLVAFPDAFSHVSVQVSAHERRLSHVFSTSNDRPELSAVLRRLTQSFAEDEARAGPCTARSARAVARPTEKRQAARRMPDTDSAVGAEVPDEPAGFRA
jgi:hypothetical protein